MKNSAAKRLRPARSRMRICMTLLAVIGVGIASRLGARHLPALIGKELGDALWSIMFFLLVLLAWPKASTLTAALLALALSCAIEFLKLYHAPWIDALRADPAAGFLLGHSFLRRDFVSYGSGTLAAATGDLLGRLHQ